VGCLPIERGRKGYLDDFSYKFEYIHLCKFTPIAQTHSLHLGPFPRDLSSLWDTLNTFQVILPPQAQHLQFTKGSSSFIFNQTLCEPQLTHANSAPPLDRLSTPPPLLRNYPSVAHYNFRTRTRLFEIGARRDPTTDKRGGAAYES
jgi:hypothetical protein